MNTLSDKTIYLAGEVRKKACVHYLAAIAQWASYLPQELLKRLGVRYNLRLGRYVPPSEPTIRRMLQSVDPDEVDQVIVKMEEPTHNS